MDESHVHHGIGFIQNEILQVLQVYMALLLKINQATRRGNNDVDTASQLLHLAFLIYPSKNSRCVELNMLGIFQNVLLNLNGQFAGRR